MSINIFSNRISLTILGLIIITAISIPLAKNVSRQYKINKEIKELENEIAELEKGNSKLQQFVSYLESDQFALEQSRLNLNYKKEGEEVVIIKNKDQSANDKSLDSILNKNAILNSQKDIARATKSNPERWWSYFFK